MLSIDGKCVFCLGVNKDGFNKSGDIGTYFCFVIACLHTVQGKHNYVHMHVYLQQSIR